MKHEGLSSAALTMGVRLTASQVGALEGFERLLAERAGGLGMVSAADLPRLRERHVLDCLRAVVAVDRSDRRAYDLGSGAGLPGIVVAIASPWLQVDLVEARGKRVAFLEFAVERLNLPNARVLPLRADALTEPVDLCFARAFADASTSWAAASSLLRPGGRLVYFAGVGFDPSTDAPAGVLSVRIAEPPIESTGSLVIMSRQ